MTRRPKQAAGFFQDESDTEMEWVESLYAMTGLEKTRIR
jgi:hypothetical protein